MLPEIVFYEGRLKSSYHDDDLISIVDDFLDQWDPSTATEIIVKNQTHLVTFYERILVRLWTFQSTLI